MSINKNNYADTVIICSNLTNAFVSPDLPFISGKTSMGRREIDRLMGLGRKYGKGPLPGFLNTALEATKKGQPIGIILIQTIETVESPDKDLQTRAASDLPKQLGKIELNAQVIKSPSNIVPWEAICRAVKTLTGRTLELGGPLDDRIRFLVTGCHTELQPFAIATHLKNAYCCEHVAVSSHLMGSSAREAHFAALRHTFLQHGVQVILDLAKTALYAGMDPSLVSMFNLSPCSLEPAQIQSRLKDDSKRIIELLCMHWSRCRLRPLAGGFSGSLLFIADGWKNDAKTEPMVLKIDNFKQMGREITGYFEVKDFLGKHIPNFGYPITVGEDTGVGMELATMDGQPETLQDAFVNADVESSFDHFIQRFDRSIQIITQRLYENTKRSEWVMPYHQFELNTSRQLRYFKMNAAVINTYLSDDKDIAIQIDGENLGAILTMIASNDDGIESETCISHGDLNYQNIICDRSNNVWFIDWTHCGRYPVELDFAKLESDVKFVISKDFDIQDLQNLKKFEEYLLTTRIPSNEKDLPKGLKFVKWDLRYRKILKTVRTIRKTCFSLKKNDDWLVYRVALLKFALHTLSFDKKRDMGECDIHQLAQALISCQQLMLDLVSDDFHLKIRGERPLSYPPRQRISIDMSPWRFKCPEYSPPYHVDQAVLDNEEDRGESGWADPEDINKVKSDFPEILRKNAKGLPLHPRGRTGIAGRGLLGRWGANPAVTAVVVRTGSDGDEMELLLGKHSDDNFFWLPKGFIYRNQDAKKEIYKVIHREFGWKPEMDTGKILSQEFSYDPRQTDNAWLEITSFLFNVTQKESPGEFNNDRAFEEVSWWPLTTDLIKNLNPSQVPFLKEAMKQLKK